MPLLLFRTHSGSRLELSADDSDSVLALKDRLRPLLSDWPSPVSTDNIRLIAKGRVLPNDAILADLDVKDCVISVVRTASNVVSAPAPTIPARQQEFLNPMAGLPPEMMRGVIQAMTSNPELMQSMMNSDPRIRQLTESHPEIRHLLNDPTFMRQRLEEMMNPNLMNEAMRNQDRAIANLESIPGGMAHLQSLYRSISEPLDRSTPTNNDDDDLNTSFARQLGVDLNARRTEPNSDALPNPWAPPQQRNTTTTQRSPPQPQTPSQTPLQSTLPQTPSQQQHQQQVQPQQPQLNQQLQSQLLFLQQMQQLSSQLNSLGVSQLPHTPTANFYVPPVQMGTPTTAASTQQQEEKPEVKFKDQLELMKDMGFTDTEKNVRALLASGGNTDAAVMYLLDE